MSTPGSDSESQSAFDASPLIMHDTH
ncbi:hypothetical protein KIPB_012464, partial [Kipferlia bialata]|eukprot:g12464.t1